MTRPDPGSPDMRLVALTCKNEHEGTPVLYVGQAGAAIGAYCGTCAVWIKWVPKTSVWTALLQYQEEHRVFGTGGVVLESGPIYRLDWSGRPAAGRSVLQDWVMELPLREQGTLLAAIRGCDLTPKYPLESLERRLVAAIRYYVLFAFDPRETDHKPGAFFSAHIPEPRQLEGVGHYPQHWFSHVWHAVEVLGYRHPSGDVRGSWHAFYLAMCKDQHTNPETFDQMVARLSEDRIGSSATDSAEES